MSDIQPEPQTSLYEKVVEDATLEAALEGRFAALEKRRAANKAFREKDAQTKSLVDVLELGEGSAVRVGRFVVTRKSVPSRHVTFDTDPTSRLQISLLPSDS